MDVLLPLLLRKRNVVSTKNRTLSGRHFSFLFFLHAHFHGSRRSSEYEMYRVAEIFKMKSSCILYPNLTEQYLLALDTQTNGKRLNECSFQERERKSL